MSDELGRLLEERERALNGEIPLVQTSTTLSGTPGADASGNVTTKTGEPDRVTGKVKEFTYQAVADPSPERVWSLADDCARLRDLARHHGFAIRSRDAKEIWEGYSRARRSAWLPLPAGDAELFEAFLKPLHDWMAEDVEVALSPEPEPVAARAPLIDESDGRCEICAGWAARKGVRDGRGQVIVPCDQCGKNLLDDELSQGRGIQGCVPHHYHLRGIGPSSMPGKVGVFQELCKDCAIALRLKVYPPDEKDKHGNFHPTAQQMREYKG